MSRLKAANNARTILTQAIDATTTSFTVASASIFPDPPFRITIDDEIMEVGAKDNATNTFSSVIRGIENTVATSHNSGAYVENRFTAGTLAELIDANEAQAKVDTHAILNQTHGIGTGYYIAKTSRTDQLPAWADIPDKPTAFNPTAHKSTHAIGGVDVLTPADIGAVKNTAGVPELLADVLANRPTPGVVGRLFFATDTGEIYRDNGTTWDLAAASRDGLAAHLADITQAHGLGGIPLVSTESKTYYIDATNGSDNNDGLTPATAFKTWAKAASMIPRFLFHPYTIVIIGNLPEDINLYNRFMVYSLSLLIKGNTTTPSNQQVNSIVFKSILGGWNDALKVQYLRINGQVLLGGCMGTTIDTCEPRYSGNIGININNSNVQVSNCDFGANVVQDAIVASFSCVYSVNNSGSATRYGLFSTGASTIGKNGTQPTGGTANEQVINGGVIR
jgi:hypothetical protein